MANTTNYNWETPDDTDLVKDGAAAIRTLGSSVDTTTKALNPSTTLGDIEYRSATANTNTRLAIGTTGQVLSVVGGVPAWVANDVGDITAVSAGTGISGGGTSGDITITNSMATAIDAKGDLIVGTGADTFSRLAVGTNTYILTADSAEATGLKWVAAAGGSALTLIGTTTFTSSTSVNVNDVFSTTYNNYKIFIVGASTNTNPSQATMRLRVSSTDTTSNYYTQEIYALSTTLATRADLFGSDEIYIGAMGRSTELESLYSIDINSPFLTTPTGLFSLNNSVPEIHLIGGGQKDSTSFTGFTLLNSQSSTGKIYVYGYSK